MSNSAADQPERTRTVAVPSLVHRSTLESLGLTSFHLSARAGYTRVIAGVTSHPTATHRVQVPLWVDDAWLGIRQQVAALQLVRPDAVASHATAAILFGWALPRRLQRGSRIHLTTTTRRIRRADVLAHCQTDLTSVECAGVRLTDSCQTLRDIAGTLSEVELHELLEGVCGNWHGPPSTKPEELLDRIPEWPRFRGSAQLLRVLPHVRTGVGSPQETRLRRTIMLDGLPEPRAAHPVTISGITFHPDLSYPDLCIAIEYEGDHHRTDSRQWDSDIRREELFREAGWAYLRVTRSTHMRAFLDRLEAEHRRRSAAR
jgi:hypothetical protein